MDEYGVEVNVHQMITNGWRLKVTIGALGVYINGFRAYPSKQDVGGWAIYPPSQKVGNRFVAVMEFDKSQPLWLEIEREAVRVVMQREMKEEELRGDQSSISPADVPF